MHITHFARDRNNPGHCYGAVAGEGEIFLFIADNATGRIEHLEQLIAGSERLVLTGPPPFYLRRLVATRCADERSGEAPYLGSPGIEGPDPE